MADSAAVTLEALTASGYEPGGAPSLESLTAFGFVPGGGGVLELVTASGTADNFDAAGAVTLEALLGSGLADSNNAASAAVVLERLTAIGYTPVAGSPVLELLTAIGQSDSGRDATGSLVTLPATATGSATGVGDAYGAPVLQTLLALAQAQNGGDARGALALRRMLASGSGASGQNATGAPVLELLVVAGSGYSERTAVGLLKLPRLGAYGSAEAALAATLDVWTMNTRTNAVTKYPSMPANSYARYNGTYLAAGPSGLLIMGSGGSTDSGGAAIPWLVRTGQLDDKKATLKRLTEVLMGVRYDGPIRVRIWQDDETYYDYSLPNLREDVLRQVRAKVGKGLRSRYYKIELSGSGVQFELDSLQATMPETTRRIG